MKFLSLISGSIKEVDLSGATGPTNIAIGNNAGLTNQGTNSIAIGVEAGKTNQPANTIILNASGAALDGVSAQTNSAYMAPVRYATGVTNALYYNASTKEITYDIVGGIPTMTSTVGGLVPTPPNNTSTFLRGDGTFAIPSGTTSTWPVGNTSGAGGPTKIAIGQNTQSINIFSGVSAVAIGNTAGQYNQGNNAVALGDTAGQGSFNTATYVSHTGTSVVLSSNAVIIVGSYITGTGFTLGQTVVSKNVDGVTITISQAPDSTPSGTLSFYKGQGAGSVAIGTSAGQVNQSSNAVSIGNSAGNTTQGLYGIAIGYFAAVTGQLSNAIAIGRQAGSNTQSSSAVAIGYLAGSSTQGGGSIAIGSSAGSSLQGSQSIAIGDTTASISQGTQAVAIGYSAGNNYQGGQSIAIGPSSGTSKQGAGAIAIGFQAAIGQQVSVSFVSTTGTTLVVNSTASLVVGMTIVGVGYTSGQTIISKDIDGVTLTTSAAANSTPSGVLQCLIGQGLNAIAIGGFCASQYQGNSAIAIGYSSGANSQGGNSVAIGVNSANRNQAANSVAVGNYAGNDTQGGASVAIGVNAGNKYQKAQSVAIGDGAGHYNQDQQSVAIGSISGSYISSGPYTLTSMTGTTMVLSSTAGIKVGALIVGGGFTSGQTVLSITDATTLQTSATYNTTPSGFYSFYKGQGSQSVAVGYSAGSSNQGNSSVALGANAGSNSQGINAVALGYSAGQTSQGANSIALGYQAGQSSQAANTIILNASGVALNGVAAQTNSLYIAPIRALTSTANYLSYNTTTKEVSYGAVAWPVTNTTGASGPTQVAIGQNAQNSSPGTNNVAIGTDAGNASQGNNTVAIGAGSGSQSQAVGAVAIGNNSAFYLQGINSVAIGNGAGSGSALSTAFTSTTGTTLVVANTSQILVGSTISGVGFTSGQTVVSKSATDTVTLTISAAADSTPSGTLNFRKGQSSNNVAVGVSAGQTNQSSGSIALGASAGQTNQGSSSIAIGGSAASNYQGNNSIALGASAGQYNQGTNAVAIGVQAAVGSITNVAYTSHTGTTLVVATTQNIAIGSVITGIGFYNGQIVSSKANDGITLTISAAPSTTPSGTLTFYSGQTSGAISLGVSAGNVYQGTSAIAIGNTAGNSKQSANSVAIGTLTGQNGQGSSGIAIGSNAGQHYQGNYSIAIGIQAGQGVANVATYVSHTGTTLVVNSTANIPVGATISNVGYHSGQTVTGKLADGITLTTSAAPTHTPSGSITFYKAQGTSSVAIGSFCASTSQGDNSVAIGPNTATNNQGGNSVAIGNNAGTNAQGANSVAIGYTTSIYNQGNNAVSIGSSSGGALVSFPTYVSHIGTALTLSTTVNIVVGSIISANGYNSGQTVTAITSATTVTTSAAPEVTPSGTITFYKGQGVSSVSLGHNAGQTNQGTLSIAIGATAGANYQGTYSIAMGVFAASVNQGSQGIAIGYAAGQGRNTTATYTSTTGTTLVVSSTVGIDVGATISGVGFYGGQTVVSITNATDLVMSAAATSTPSGTITFTKGQGANAIAIGPSSGKYNQGTNSVAIGGNAGLDNQAANTIILNATGSALNGVASQTNSLYIDPIRAATSTVNYLSYNTTTKEITYGAVAGIDAGAITTGTIAAARLPAYVDDVLEYANLAAFPGTGTAGIIYVAIDTNKTYRWSGSAYIYITSGAVDSVGGNTGVVTAAQLLTAVQSQITLTGSNTGDNAVNSLYSGLVSNATHTGEVTGDTALTITANAVTNAKLAQIATDTFKGRITAATGDVEDLSATQATSMLDVFSSTLKGLAPASGGGTTNFLRADGTWAPAGSSGVKSLNAYFLGNNTNITGTIRRYLEASSTISAIYVRVPTAIATNAVITLKKNGSVINTSTLLATTTEIATTGLSLSVAFGDYLTMDLASAGITDVSIQILYS